MHNACILAHILACRLANSKYQSLKNYCHGFGLFVFSPVFTESDESSLCFTKPGRLGGGAERGFLF